jgi:hypothetical protein
MLCKCPNCDCYLDISTGVTQVATVKDIDEVRYGIVGQAPPTACHSLQRSAGDECTHQTPLADPLVVVPTPDSTD